MKTNRARNQKAFKTILLGDCQVGKTSIIERFVSNSFNADEQPTIGIDFFTKALPHQGKSYKIQLWDTAGQEKYMSLIPTYLRDPDCVLFVFDLHKPESLDDVQKWITLFRENQDRQALCLLCGNKSDLSNQTGRQKIQKLTSKYKIGFHSLSAKTGQNITEVFSLILSVLVKKYQKDVKNILEKKLVQDLDGLETQSKLSGSHTDPERVRVDKENSKQKQNTCSC